MEIIVDDVNYKEEVLQSELPVLVDFWAAWCMPCLAIAPTVAQLAKEYKGRIKVCKINVDDAGVTAGKCQIQSIPTLAIYVKGVEVKRVIGGLPKAQLESLLKPYLDIKK